MFIKQLSIFIENREGRLEKVTEILATNNINIVCISLADTSEYGLLRMIVSDPMTAREVLKENGFSAMLTDVIAVKLPHHFGMLNKLTKVLCDKNLNIEYMYALTSGKENASIVIKTSDNAMACDAIEEIPLEILDPNVAYHM
ncbi:MAG TPA: amino acid-binding protein [Lachnospiraceae bacterium]|nr:amino acid-binding protein [Lachnospiraceae bacterium]